MKVFGKNVFNELRDNVKTIKKVPQIAAVG